MQIPRPSLALDLHFACYATPYTNGITHGGEVQAPRALVALDLRVICYTMTYMRMCVHIIHKIVVFKWQWFPCSLWRSPPEYNNLLLVSY